MENVNRKYYQCIFLCLFLLVVSLCINAQSSSVGDEVEIVQNGDTTKISSEEAEIDNSTIHTAKIPTDKIKNYREDDNFNYNREEPKSQGFWAFILSLVNRFIRAFFSDEGAISYLRYIFLAIVVGFIIYQIFKRNLKGLFVSNKKIANDNKVYFNDENIYEEDIDNKLQTAIRDKDFRLAVRFYYILLLKKLDQKQLINWKLGKTNQEYRVELKKSEIFKSFSDLSLLYEYSWYGNFEIFENEFHSYSNNFNSLFEKL